MVKPFYREEALFNSNFDEVGLLWRNVVRLTGICKIRSGVLNVEDTVIPVDGLAAGIYILKIDNRKAGIYKMIKI